MKIITTTTSAADKTVAPGMNFARLPIELRLIIWGMALDDESKNRVIFYSLHNDACYPIKSLASPFLFVNQESREQALEQYPTRIEVKRLAELVDEDKIHKKIEQRQTAGYVYLGLNEDHFVLVGDYSKLGRCPFAMFLSNDQKHQVHHTITECCVPTPHKYFVYRCFPFPNAKEILSVSFEADAAQADRLAYSTEDDLPSRRSVGGCASTAMPVSKCQWHKSLIQAHTAPGIPAAKLVSLDELVLDITQLLTRSHFLCTLDVGVKFQTPSIPTLGFNLLLNAINIGNLNEYM
ncbi:hypothetical protein SCAR479_10101 [Seiridium cardinale]|uniref:2EXR domain-containing protein n=1 Tax=Seiridium cardinale TaxID=138064 RepID=A0ABR2XHL7_9PEZI